MRLSGAVWKQWLKIEAEGMPFKKANTATKKPEDVMRPIFGPWMRTGTSRVRDKIRAWHSDTCLKPSHGGFGYNGK